MNLSIAQSFLLLALPENGQLPIISVTDNWLIAAGLLELVLSGCAEISDEKIKLSADLPDDKTYLSALYEYLKSTDKSLSLLITDFSIQQAGKSKKQLLDDTLDSLVSSDVVNYTSQANIFGSRDVYPPQKPAVNQVVETLRKDVFQNEPQADSLALAMLLDKAGHLKYYLSKYERKEFSDRMKVWQENSQIQAVAEMIEQTMFILSFFVIFLGAN